ncbi:MAG: hypothetical protein ACK5LN_09550 [Propioniciclava sp.]
MSMTPEAPLDPREELLAILVDDGIHFHPRGSSLDVLQIFDWPHGNCDSPVILRAPEFWVSRFAEEDSLSLLAILIAEEMGVDTETQLVELSIEEGWKGHATLSVTRR